MQRCPYIYEMKERLLKQRDIAMESLSQERDNLLDNSSRPASYQVGQVGTVVKVRLGSLQTPEVIQVIQLF
jgi:hypothetical protein